MALDEVVQCTEPPTSLPPSCSLPFFLLSRSPPFLVSLPLSFPVSKVYNHVLALDEVVQFTDQDEWAYHEMAAHIPLCSHPNPRSVSGVHATTLELLHSSLCSSLCSTFSCLFLLFLYPFSSSWPVSFFSLTSSSIQFPSFLHLFLPSSLLTLTPSLLPISQGAGGRRGRWRCAERGCQTQDCGGDTHL